MSTVNLGKLYQGDSVQLDFVVQDQDGNVVDLTGATVKWGLALQSDIDAPVLTKTSPSSGIAITDAANGTCSVTIDKGDIDTAGNFYHELEVTLASGLSHTYAQGTVIVLPTVYPTT